MIRGVMDDNDELVTQHLIPLISDRSPSVPCNPRVSHPLSQSPHFFPTDSPKLTT